MLIYLCVFYISTHFFVSQNGTEKLLAQISRVRDDTSSDYARLYNPFLITISKSPVLINYPYFYTGVSAVISCKVSRYWQYIFALSRILKLDLLGHSIFQGIFARRNFVVIEAYSELC